VFKSLYGNDRRVNIVPISAFTDNYIWCLHLDNQRAIVVDPGDPEVVKAYLADNNLELAGVLVTHHHFDHTGGIEALASNTSVAVIGPKSSPFTGLTQTVEGNSRFRLESLDIHVLAVPGHTLDHVAYYLPDIGALFCGDTLFSGGCGRVFEGTFEQMRCSLAAIRELPKSTKMFCAHEYTAANLRFALAVEPDNADLQERVAEVSRLRELNQPSLPTTLADECRYNPFLRWDKPAVISSAQSKESVHDADGVFRVIRQWKDTF
jgi:hydroxyacylglutathione hydrolase